MKVILNLDGRTASGGSPLVCHNERLADPLDPIVRTISTFTAKRKKTEADHLEIARLEFLGGLYTSPPIPDPQTVNGNTPGLPAWNILRCLQDGARRHKRGLDVPRGVYPQTDFAELSYAGDDIRHPAEMWKAGTFSLRKTVGVQRSRTMRTRPIFTDWQASLPVEFDATVFDLDTLASLWHDAGIYAGIGEMRPIYGRFNATIEEVAQ